MSLITGLLYAVLAAYLGGWYLGHWHGNFSLLLFILTLIGSVRRGRHAPAGNA